MAPQTRPPRKMSHGIPDRLPEPEPEPTGPPEWDDPIEGLRQIQTPGQLGRKQRDPAINRVIELTTKAPCKYTLEGLTLLKGLMCDMSEKVAVAQRELRNKVAAMCQILALNPSHHELFLQCGLTEVILTLSCGPELGLSCPRSVSSIEACDFRFKETLWDTIFELGKHGPSSAALLEMGLASACSQYLDVDCSLKAVTRWPTKPLLKLQAQALHIIARFANNEARFFQEAQCAERMLSFLPAASQLEGTGLQEASLTTLFFLANSPNKQDLFDQGLVPQMLQLALGLEDIDLKRQCWQIISDLHRGELGPDQSVVLLECGGIEALCQHLGTEVWEAEPVLKFMAALVDVVWNAVIDSPDTLDRFVQQQGVGLLLDVLDRSPIWLQQPSLACLVDLLGMSEEGVAQALEWRNKSHQRTIHKIILQQWDNLSHPAKHDLSKEEEEGMRTKLFCLQRFFGFKAHETLTFDEKIALVDLSDYLCSRRDAAYRELEAQLDSEGLRPVRADRELLEMERQASEARLARIEQQKDKIRAAKTKALEEDEKTFYRSLLKKTGDEIKADSTTVGLSITQAKLRKTEMLKESFRNAKSEPQLLALSPKPISPTVPTTNPSDSYKRAPPASAPPKGLRTTYQVVTGGQKGPTRVSSR